MKYHESGIFVGTRGRRKQMARKTAPDNGLPGQYSVQYGKSAILPFRRKITNFAPVTFLRPGTKPATPALTFQRQPYIK